ncbi:hypothetical protein NAI67_13150, partial [Francisella tularensis subsp. holarctica]|nr:hypothetical protein [Francisella tularensis subsp. holarctica]
INLESGKPLAEAKVYVIFGSNFIKWYAEKSKRIDSRVFAPNISNAEGRGLLSCWWGCSKSSLETSQ